MVIVSWFKEIRSRSDKAKFADARTAAQYVLNRLLELLACGDPASPTPGSNVPYSELIRMYAKMRGEAGTLKKHIEYVGGYQTSLVKLPSIDTISAQAAVDFTTKLSPQCPSQNGDLDMPMTSIDTMELCRQQLLATAGYLQVYQVRPTGSLFRCSDLECSWECVVTILSHVGHGNVMSTRFPFLFLSFI